MTRFIGGIIEYCKTRVNECCSPGCVLQEWVPIIRHDIMTQRKMKAQPPLSDAYLHGMPAKRRKVTSSSEAAPAVRVLLPSSESPVCVCVCVCLQTGQSGENLLSLSDAVSQAARTAGVKPLTSPEQLQEDLESQELKEAYSDQVNGPDGASASVHTARTQDFLDYRFFWTTEVALVLGYLYSGAY